MSVKKTFTVFAERVDPEAGFDGLVAIMNNTLPTAGKTIAIESVRVMKPSPINSDLTNLYGTQGILSLDRVTAYSGGTEIPATKFDTGAGSLPSTVKFMSFPDSVTGATPVRKFGDAISTYNITTAIPFQAMMRAPSILDVSESGRNMESHNVLHKANVSDIEPITLREGEGLACIQRDFGIPQSSHFSITVKVTSTGYTYRYKVINNGSPYGYDEPKWVLFNGSGSGVVITVWVVSHSDLGEQNIPRLRLTKIGGMDWQEIGVPTTLTPIKHDTGADLSGVNAYIGDFKPIPLSGTQGVQVDYQNYQGTPITVAVQQKFDTYRQFLCAEPKISLTHSPIIRFENEHEVWSGDRRGVFAIDDEIVLRAGEGFAVIGGGNGGIETSELCYVNIEIIANLVSPDASGGFPVVGNSGLVRTI